MNRREKDFIKRLEEAENKSKIGPQTSGVFLFNPLVKDSYRNLMTQMSKDGARGLVVPRIPAEQWGKQNKPA